MYKVTVDKNSDGQRADKFIKKILPLAPNSFIYKMFRKKDVKVNGVRIKEDTFVYEGDVMELFLYEDNELLYTTPVTTGKDSTPSDTGLFKIKYRGNYV